MNYEKVKIKLFQSRAQLALVSTNEYSTKPTTIDIRCLSVSNFLAITASNLDEFFRVRVGGLKLVTDQTQVDLAGLPPREQLRKIRLRVREMIAEQSSRLVELEQKLEQEGIIRVSAADVTKAERELAAQTI